MSPAAPARTWRQVEARVLAHRDAGAGHRWLELTVPRGFREPRPGEFVQLLLAEPSGVFLPRPMSVASAAKKAGALALGFLYAPVGAGTRLLAALEVGARVEVLGPLGRGFPLERAGVPVLVAGGRGVAPLLFAAEALAARGGRGGAAGRAPRALEFVFGARTKAQLVGLAEARRDVRAAGGRLHLATDDGSVGLRGTVLDALDALAPKLEGPPVVHACGPHGMLRAIAEWALARRTPAFLAMESVMACGIGVCRGCPLPRAAEARDAFDADRTPSLFGNREYAMCCTEGPVFEADDLDWSRIE